MAPASAQKPRSLRQALFVAALLVLVDAFVLNQGGIALFVGIGLLLIGLPRTFLPRCAQIRRDRLRNIAVYLAAVVCVLGLNTANNVLAQARAERVVSAVKAYHSKYQCYPQSLSHLSPEFIERIPLAKYTLVVNRFWYAGATDRQAPFLFYVAAPPFGRVTYSFGRNECGYLD